MPNVFDQFDSGDVQLPDVGSGEGIAGRGGKVSAKTQAARDEASRLLRVNFEPEGDTTGLNLRDPAKPKQVVAPSANPFDQFDPPPKPKTFSAADVATGPILSSGSVAEPKPGESTGSTFDYAANQFKLGVASLPGLPGNLEAARNAVQSNLSPGARETVQMATGMLNPLQVIEPLIKAAREKLGLVPQQNLSGLVTGQQPTAKTAFPTAEELAKPLLGFDPNLKPADKAQEMIGDFANFVGSMVGPGGVGKAAATKVFSVLKDAGFPLTTELVQQTMGQVFKQTAKEVAKASVPAAAAVAGGEAAQAAFGEGPGTKAIGQVAGGVAPAAYILARANLPQYLEDLKGTFRGVLGTMEPVAAQKAKNMMANGMNEFPASFANAQEASTLAKRVNETLAAATPEGQTAKGVVLSPGQMTAAPQIIANEIAARGSTPAYIAAAVDRDAMNSAALLDYMRNDNSPAAISRKMTLNNVENGVNERFAALKAQEDGVRQHAQNLADSIAPASTAEERGLALVGQRQVEKEARLDPVKNALFAQVDTAAKNANAKFDPESINAVAQKLTKDPVLGYDPANLPAVVRIIKAKTGPVEDAAVTSLKAQGYSDALIQKFGLPPTVAPPLTYDDISAMRRAVNDDIRGELARLPIGTQGNQSSRVRALQEVKETIDGTIANSPYPEVAKAYTAAVDYYKNTYAPALKEGINARLALMSSDGRARVLDEKVLDSYTTPTGANEFLNLFGKNPVALSTMGDHIMDRLAGVAIKDGVLEPTKLRAFLMKNLPVLTKLKQAGLPTLDSITNVQSAAEALAQRMAFIKDNYQQLANDKLTKLFGTADVKGLATRMGASFEGEVPHISGNQATVVEQALKDPYSMIRLVKAAGPDGSKALAESILGDISKKFTFTADSGRIGIDHKALSDWLQQSQRSLRPLFRAAYGAQEGQEHLQRLLDANRLLSIQERVPIGKITGGTTNVGKDPLAAATGISFKNIWNVFKAVTQGRQNEVQGALSLGGPMMSHLMVKSYNQLMQRIASDPESSKYLLQLAQDGSKPMLTKSNITSNAKAISGLLAKAGYVYMGGKYYGPALMQLTPGVAGQATQGVQ